MCKNDDLSSHQSSIKVPVLIESKGVGLSLEILKALKGLLQNVYLMLELLYHKRNPLLRLLYMVVFFKKTFKIETVP